MLSGTSTIPSTGRPFRVETIQIFSTVGLSLLHLPSFFAQSPTFTFSYFLIPLPLHTSFHSHHFIPINTVTLFHSSQLPPHYIILPDHVSASTFFQTAISNATTRIKLLSGASSSTPCSISSNHDTRSPTTNSAQTLLPTIK